MGPGGRLKSEGIIDICGERKKAAEDLKMRMIAQVKLTFNTLVSELF